MVARTRLDIMLYVQCLSFFFFRKIIGWQWSVIRNISMKIIKVIITGSRSIKVKCTRTQELCSLGNHTNLDICRIPDDRLCWEDTFLRICEAASSDEIDQLLTYFTEKL